MNIIMGLSGPERPILLSYFPGEDRGEIVHQCGYDIWGLLHQQESQRSGPEFKEIG